MKHYNETRIERIAPSPTGRLHLGHAYSMLKVLKNKTKFNGKIHLRIDDLDINRCKDEYIEDILINIDWLKIPIEKTIYKQTNHFSHYRSSLKKLNELGLLYKCKCSRRDIKEALSAPHNLNNIIHNKIYPQTCKNKKINDKNFCFRIDLKKSLDIVKEKDLFFVEEGQGPNKEVGLQKFSKKFLLNNFGDFIVARKDVKSSYNLAVVIDDNLQKITHVTRGNDLFETTKIQVLLQLLLEIPRNKYYHHKLIKNKNGDKLSKRNKANSLKSFRENNSLIELYKTLNIKDLELLKKT